MQIEVQRKSVGGLRAGALAAACLLLGIPLLGSASGRLNKVVELMEARRPALGVFSGNLSTRTGAALGSSSLDFVIVDLEHSPYDPSRLEGYLLAMTDKRRLLEQGHLQPSVTPLVRLPGNGREQLQFLIKQALDLGAMGIVVPHVDTPADALAAVRASRFPQLSGSIDRQPEGQRGVGYGWAARYWGLSGSAYTEKADLWPLDPNGEILLWVMMETEKAVQNCRQIASVPGIGGLFIGPSDLAFSLGVPLGDSRVESAMEEIAAVCRETGVPCGTLCGSGEVRKRLDQGFRFLAVGGDSGLSGDVMEALRIGRAP